MSPEFKKEYTEMLIDGWNKMLSVHKKEIPFCLSTEDDLKELIKAFEDKYDKKLKYRINGLAYVSYEVVEHEIKIPTKYTASKLKGVLIKHVIAYSDGKFIVENVNGDKKEFMMNMDKEDMPNYSADYLLCEVQDDSDIHVSKY